MSNGVPTDPIQALLAQTSLQRNLFSGTSRYFGLDTLTLTMPNGKTVIYLARRFVPAPDRFQLQQEYSVKQGDRLDNIAATYLGDPEQFWRLADANGAMRPEVLLRTVGRRLKIALPEGISGTAL
jgi:hypothetical protein